MVVYDISKNHSMTHIVKNIFILPYFIQNNAPVICNHCSPTYGEGRGLCLFKFPCPAMSPTPRGKLEVKTLLFAPPFTIENLPGIRILMSKSCHIPLKSNCPALQPIYHPPFPVCVWGGGGGGIQMTGS